MSSKKSKSYLRRQRAKKLRGEYVPSKNATGCLDGNEEEKLHWSTRMMMVLQRDEKGRAKITSDQKVLDKCLSYEKQFKLKELLDRENKLLETYDPYSDWDEQDLNDIGIQTIYLFKD